MNDKTTTESLKEAYERDGVVTFDPGIDISIIDEVSRFIDSDPTIARSRRVQDAWKRCEAAKAIATHPGVVSVIRELYGKEPLPFQTLHMRHGSVQRIHSDEYHFSSYPHGNMCGAWVAIEDIHEDSGPLAYYPGSHKLPFVSPQSIRVDTKEASYPEYEDHIARMITHLGLGGKRTFGVIKKGHCIVWASNLLHGGSPIFNDSLTRKTQVTHYFFEEGSRFFYTPMLSNPADGRFAYRDLNSLRIR